MFDEHPVPRLQLTSNKALDPPAEATAGQRQRSAHRSPLGGLRMTQAEDSGRFYALRMQETGLIKWSPQKIMAQGTSWRFLNDLKRE
jgi:hypothetical protein